MAPKSQISVITGFTLIEILIVIVIISIVSGIAALTITHNQQKNLNYLANSLAHILVLAEEEAMLRPATLGLAFAPTYFRFFEYHPKVTTKQPHHWQALTDKIFGMHPIPKNIKITLWIQGKETVLNGQPQIIISMSGDSIPFVIFIGEIDKNPVYQVIGNANGEIKSELVHEK